MAFVDFAVTNSMTNAAVPATIRVLGTRVLAFVSSDDDTGPFNTPSGWVALGTITNLTVDGQIFQVFELDNGTTKGITAGNIGNTTYTWTAAGSSSDSIVIIAGWSGRSQGAITISQTTNNAGTNTPFNAVASGVTAAAGDDLVVFTALDEITGFIGFSMAVATGTAGTFTLRASQDNGGGSAMSLSTLDNVAAGATGTVTVPINNTANPKLAAWGTYVITIPAGNVVVLANVIFFSNNF